MSLGLGLVSPGITIREIDLTKGSIVEDNQFIGAIAGPFPKGPVEEAVVIRNENEFIETFGKPVTTDNQSDYYHVAESFLSYGGVLKVIRCSDANLNSANVGVGSTTSVTLNIKNYDDYTENHSDSVSWEWAAKTPGAWANNLKVAIIDDFADQTFAGLSTSSLTVGMAVTCRLEGARVTIGVGVTYSWNSDTVLEGTLTGLGVSEIYVKWNTYNTGVSTFVQYKKGSNFEVKSSDGDIIVGGVSMGPADDATITDWYDGQTVVINGIPVYWRSLAPKPISSSFAIERRSYNDSVHILVIDDKGTATGVSGNIVEKFTNLSKALDATLSGKTLYYKERIALESTYVYAGYPQDGNVSKAGITTSNGLWGLKAVDSVDFNVIGNQTILLVGGVNYTGGGFNPSLGELSDAYDIVASKDQEEIDFLIYGPSMLTKEESQAKANKLIEIAESRKDTIVTISPFKDDVVAVSDAQSQTDDTVEFFNGIDSSSFAVFDSGYKYIYDRFSNKYRYIPCNGDIAGLMVRTSVDNYSWYSPAGADRGTLKNAIKLAYNPNQSQRDQLYTNRVNPVIYSPGSGVILFGDKTAQTFVSAFDRINVRRLFLEIEKTISNIAKTYLFEFNDEFTRTSFVSQVDPYLRDIAAKRGITEYVVVCDQTNNTPEVIDRNEFVAEFYVKPARSINFIGLTFVATKTGINFEEVIGRF